MHIMIQNFLNLIDFFPSWTAVMCVFKYCFEVKSVVHKTCLFHDFKFEHWPNLVSHISHLNGVFPSLTADVWIDKLAFLEKFYCKMSNRLVSSPHEQIKCVIL